MLHLRLQIRQIVRFENLKKGNDKSRVLFFLPIALQEDTRPYQIYRRLSLTLPI